MQCHAMPSYSILDTTGTQYTFYENEITKEIQNHTNEKNKKQETKKHTEEKKEE